MPIRSQMLRLIPPQVLARAALAGAAVAASLTCAVAQEPPSGRVDLAQMTILRKPADATAARAANEAREVDQYLGIVRRLRSECGNAAWTLWHSNSYANWRDKKSSMLSMHFSTGSYPSLPSAPSALPEPVRTKLGESIKRANDTLGDAGRTFKDLADYINAKDYEDDKFKKGDALNAKLVENGRTCHELDGTITAQLVEATEGQIEARRAASAKPDVVGVMVADWKIARSLSRELARFAEADTAKLDGLVKDVSALVEQRRESFEPLKQNPPHSLKRFYDTLNDDVAVKMRRLMRDARNAKVFKEASTDRPRSAFWSARNEIDIDMPDSILSYIRDAK